MIGGSMMDSLMESAARGKGTPLKEGEVIRLKGLQVTVLETNHHGPTRVEFKFDRHYPAVTICYNIEIIYLHMLYIILFVNP